MFGHAEIADISRQDCGFHNPARQRRAAKMGGYALEKHDWRAQEKKA